MKEMGGGSPQITSYPYSKKSLILIQVGTSVYHNNLYHIFILYKILRNLVICIWEIVISRK